MTEWPELQQELGRKSLDQIDKWSRNFAKGKITARELYLISTALYDATSGLMKLNDSEVIAAVNAEALSEARSAKKETKHVG